MSRRRGIVLAKQVSARVESKSAPQVESECIGGVNAPLLCSGRFLISDSAGPWRLQCGKADPAGSDASDRMRYIGASHQ